MTKSAALLLSDESTSSHRCQRFPLITCPPLAKGVRYCLIGHDGSEPRIAATGLARHDHGPLNLAEVRHAGAVLNAWEIWVFAPAGLDRVGEQFNASIQSDTRHDTRYRTRVR